MKIDYNELPKNFKKESFTKLEVYLRKQGSYPKDWNSTDELMFYTFLIQLQVIRQHELDNNAGEESFEMLFKKKENPVDIWRQNVTGCINKFWDKLDDDGSLKDLSAYILDPHTKDDYYEEEQFGYLSLTACDGFDKLPSDKAIELKELIDKRDREEAKEQKRLEKATKIAKAELRKEQQLLYEQRVKEEAEREAKTLKVIHPIKGYLKHDQ